MKNIVLFCLLVVGSIAYSKAQTGPGGVGNSSNNILWLDASQLNLNDGDPVATWPDSSGNNNDAIQLDPSKQAQFDIDNGKYSIQFDGTDDYFDFTSNITSDGLTSFIIMERNSGLNTQTSVLSLSKHLVYSVTNNIRSLYSGLDKFLISFPNNSLSMYAMQTGANSISDTLTVYNQSSSVGFNRGAHFSSSVSSLGSVKQNQGAGAYVKFYNGYISEVVLFNERISSAKRKIVSEYLATKHNLISESSLYAYRSTHSHDLIGIGQESDGSHTVARGRDSLEISNPSTLGNGDYLLVAHDNGGYATSSDVGVLVNQRWTQVWRADVTGTPGTVDLTFYLGNNDFAGNPSDYVVYIENANGDFTDGGTSIQESGRSYDAVNKTVTFSGISLSDGDYFTLAEKFLLDASLAHGPGGVGNTSSIEAWLDASKISASDGDPIDIWSDLSGNLNNAVQNADLNYRPTYNVVNGIDFIHFDGNNDYLDFKNNVTTDALTSFMVINRTVSNNTQSCLFNLNKHAVYIERNFLRPLYANLAKHLLAFDDNVPILLATQTGSNLVGDTLTAYEESNAAGFQRGGFFNISQSTIGSINFSGSGYSKHFEGDIAEIILFNEQLNSAKRKIVSNYLGAKYDLTPEESLFNYASSHGNEVFGIGQESDGNHTSSRGNDSLEVSNASSLGNGDYVLIGNDGGDFNPSASVPSSAVERWNRTWRADITGTPGTVDLRFYLSGNVFAAPSDYVILAETVDGDFSNGGTSIIASNPSYDAATTSILFTGVNLTDGMTFTLAENNTNITSTGTGDWNTPATWSCNCVPTTLNNVTIQSPHVITIGADAHALGLDLQSGAELSFSGSHTLSVHDDLTLAGTFTEGTGTLALVKPTDDQLVYNNTGSTINLHNLRVNNNQGASFENGGWSLSNNLEVNAGGLDVSNALSFTLQSNVSGSSQVLESMSGAFTGNFTVERYISDRQTSYANISAPVSNADAGDLDDDFYLSGLAGGGDADILLGGGVTFYSVWRYNAATASHEELTNVSDALTPGRGYEVYIEPNARTYTSGAMDYEGTLNSGTVGITLSQGFNLVGNPYHSFINFGNLGASGMSSTFYIWDTDAGNYATLGTADNIAPAQGFWVNKTTAGSTTLNFNENDKVNSNANTFLREKKGKNNFKLELSNQVNQYKHALELKFSPNASASIDEEDAFHLPSPLKEAPALVAKIEGSEQGLVINNLNQWEAAHRIPLEVKAGVAGDYRIQAEELETLYEKYNCVYLHDKAEKQNIDLSVEPTYEFFAKAGKHQRFELLLGNSFANCEQALNEGGLNQAIEDQLKLRNAHGHWYLDYEYQDQMSRNLEIKILNLNGQEVINTQSLGVNGFGSYQIEGLENLNGIYLIQIKTADAFINQKVKL